MRSLRDGGDDLTAVEVLRGEVMRSLRDCGNGCEAERNYERHAEVVVRQRADADDRTSTSPSI